MSEARPVMALTTSWYVGAPDAAHWQSELEQAGYDVADITGQPPDTIAKFEPPAVGLVVINRTVAGRRDPHGPKNGPLVEESGAIHNAGVGYAIRAAGENDLPVYLTGEAPKDDAEKLGLSAVLGHITMIIEPASNEEN